MPLPLTGFWWPRVKALSGLQGLLVHPSDFCLHLHLEIPVLSLRRNLFFLKGMPVSGWRAHQNELD